MPKVNDRGVAALVIVLIVVVLLGLAVFLNYSGVIKNINPSQTDSVSESEKKAEKVPGWKTFNFKYAQVSIDYPPDWLVKYIPNKYQSVQYADFFPVKDNAQITTDYLITLNVQPDTEAVDNYAPQSYGDPNFNIPSLGEGQNAFYSQDSGGVFITFTHKGIRYNLNANLSQAVNNDLDPAEIVTVFSKMAKSMRFTSEVGSCEDPVLVSEVGFPEEFALNNYHKSDTKDKVVGYWPDLTGEPVIDNNTSDTRFFVVTYQKEGKPFDSSTEFDKTIVPITGGIDSFNTDITTITAVNCLSKINRSSYPIFNISESGKPFTISVWGNGDNSTKLWGVEKWNVDLMKRQRGTVYVKLGDKWQKYTAKEILVAL